MEDDMNTTLSVIERIDVVERLEDALAGLSREELANLILGFDDVRIAAIDALAEAFGDMADRGEFDAIKSPDDAVHELKRLAKELA